MANPASFTITAAVLNSAINQPAVQTVDTTGTVPIDAGSETGRMIIEVINAAAAILTVKVLAGTNPPALRAGQGDLTVTMAATGTATDKRIIGPFESARFVDADGKLQVNFTPASGSPNATVRVYRLPKA